MLILGIILFGFLIGWLAQFILGRAAYTTDWTMALVAGLAGSFVGGLLASLIAGDGLALKPSGIIGSLVGALIITAIWQWYANKKRPGGPMPPVAQVFEFISTAKVAKSAAEAQDMLILREGDGITMNRDRLLFDAKAKALAMVDGYVPPEPVELRLPGPGGKAALTLAVEGFHQQGKATDHDVTVSLAVADVLTGGDTDVTETVTEEALLKEERAGFLKLLRTTPTLDRIEHMLTTGRPLRN